MLTAAELLVDVCINEHDYEIRITHIPTKHSVLSATKLRQDKADDERRWKCREFAMKNLERLIAGVV